MFDFIKRLFTTKNTADAQKSCCNAELVILPIQSEPRLDTPPAKAKRPEKPKVVKAVVKEEVATEEVKLEVTKETKPKRPAKPKVVKAVVKEEVKQAVVEEVKAEPKRRGRKPATKQ